MKTDTRTELEGPEDLQDVIKKFIPYWPTIAGVCAVIVVGALAFGFVTSSRQRAEESSWTEFLSAAANRDPVALEQLAQTSTGSVSPWAQQAAAQAKLIESSALIHSDRAAATRGFQEAVDGFSKAMALAEESGLELIQQRTIWGLGQAHEGLNELGKAKEHYQQVIDRWPDSALAEQARLRIASLNDPKTQAFYQWFFTQAPPARLPASGAVPNLPFEVPNAPDVTIPDPLDFLPPSAVSDPTDDEPDPIESAIELDLNSPDQGSGTGAESTDGESTDGESTDDESTDEGPNEPQDEPE